MDLAELAEQLRSGQITIGQWEASMRSYLRSNYEAAMTLVKGGRDNITQSDWGYEGSLLKKQYAYLNNFAKEMQANPAVWSNKRLDARMNLYKESAYTAMEDMQRRNMQQNGFTRERRVLDPSANNCDDCIEYAGMGWQPIGTLPAIGESVCIVNCKCEFEYDKEDA